MANKRLSTDQVEEMKAMVVQGVYPEDIAQHFHIAVSSVHNYKNRFREEGLQFPSVKGKRPSGAISPTDSLAKVREQMKPDSNRTSTTGSSVVGVMNNTSTYKFIINGVSVEIGDGAKSVNIGKDSMEIRF
jgi:transposase